MKLYVHIIVLLLLFPSISNADTIASWSGHSQRGYCTPPEVTVSARIAADEPNLPNGDIPWENLFDLVLTVNDVGRTFVNTQGPEFDAVKEMLLNGTAYRFGFYIKTGGEIFYPGMLPGWQDSFNFTGYDIDSAEFKLNELRFWTDKKPWEPKPIDYVFINYTISIQGHPTALVPEPATTLLFAIGLIGTAGFRQKFRN